MTPYRTEHPIITTGQQEFWFTVCLTEGEARVLVALFGYGTDELKKLHATLGTHYMNEADPTGEHMKTLGKKCWGLLPPQLARADRARIAFKETTPTA